MNSCDRGYLHLIEALKWQDKCVISEKISMTIRVTLASEHDSEKFTRHYEQRRDQQSVEMPNSKSEISSRFDSDQGGYIPQFRFADLVYGDVTVRADKMLGTFDSAVEAEKAMKEWLSEAAPSQKRVLARDFKEVQDGY